MSFIDFSYSEQSKTYKDIKPEDGLNLYEHWFDNNTTDLWRHMRFLNLLLPIINQNKSSKWLTIADGRFGTSAMFLEKHGIDVTATDIDTRLLAIALKKKMIKQAQFANAEDLPFENNSFDFSFCKEALHHFPQPFKAIYEMLRVSKKGVVLSEPRDWIPMAIPIFYLRRIKNFIKKIFKIQISHTDTGNYEVIGNYIYTISEREIEKTAMALNYSAVAFKKMHDIYIEGVENEVLNKRARLFKKIKLKILINRILVFFGLSNNNRLFAIIFKEDPSELLIKELRRAGFEMSFLPKNPYC